MLWKSKRTRQLERRIEELQNSLRWRDWRIERLEAELEGRKPLGLAEFEEASETT